MKIAPSMLASDYTRMGACARAVQNADLLHLDIMDGHFVPNISFGPDVVHALRPVSALLFDVHLMLTHPLRYAEKFAAAGADILTIHIECADDVGETLREIERLGMKPALTLKPGTPVSALFPYLDRIHMALIMTVEPGFGGQKFMPEQLEKARVLRDMHPGLLLEADGGITTENIALCAAAGIDIAVAGTTVFGAPDVPAAIEALRRAAD